MTDPTAVYETTWWEHVRDEKGELQMSPFVDGVSSPIMRNLTTGEESTRREMPVGALYAAVREPNTPPNRYPRAGADGHSIMCLLADGHSWNIEGRASNCTKPDEPSHRCWVRHGTIGEKLTVDKNGLTCAAGAGSFWMGRNNEWHGFLREGKLTP